MDRYSTNNAIVDAVGRINFTGVVIPFTWDRTVVDEKGRPNLRAQKILSQIVYWYRPKEIMDESTGEFIGFEKKFSKDLLQWSYDAIANKFNCTKRQATETIIFLEKLGVVRRVFRNLKKGTATIANVLFIELIPEKLMELTFPQEKEEHGEDKEDERKDEKKDRKGGLPKNGDTSPKKLGHLSQNIGTRLPENRETNTKNTTKTTTKNNLSINRDGQTDTQAAVEKEIRELLHLDDDQNYEEFRTFMSPEEYENYKEIPAILTEMITDRQPKTYNGCYVSCGQKVRQKVNTVVSKDEHHNLMDYGIRASKNFLGACTGGKPPKSPAAYFKSVLWTSLSTYAIEDHAEFQAAYYGRRE